MMDKILIYLLKRKINNLIKELNHILYVSNVQGRNRCKEVIELDNCRQSQISRSITILEDAINTIKN